MVNLTEDDEIFHSGILYVNVDKVDNFVDKSKNSEKTGIFRYQIM